jgi:hypothetical protein
VDALVTILRNARDGRGRPAVLAKRWTGMPDGRAPVSQGYDRAFRFDAEQRSVTGAEDLYKLLLELAGDHRACVVRGEPIGDGKNIRRKSTGAEATLRDAPTSVLALDLDHVPLPDHIDPRHDLDACIETALALLPECFQAASCVVQFTASHGYKPGARLRLWYRLSRPIISKEVKHWLHQEIETRLIDRSLYSPVQPHYTSAVST